MSTVLVVPELLEAAAADVARIGSAVRAGNLAAALPTTELAAAGADEVSAAIAAAFGVHATEYQAVAAQAETIYQQFVRNLTAAAASYAGTEAAIVTSLQGALGAVNAPTQLLGNPAQTIGEAWSNSRIGQLLGGGTGGAATATTTTAAQKIVIDFVRHGETASNAASLIDTAVPGPGLNLLGQTQASTIAATLAGNQPYAGVFASELIRTQQTAAPLATMLGISDVPVLPGLNEINAGVFDGSPQLSLQGVLYLVGPVAWTLGFPIVPMLAPGSTHVNGIVFDRGFDGAVQTMYSTATAPTTPVVSPDGNITTVAYSSALSIEVGTLMNVDNPNPLLMLTHPLPNTGTIVVQGNPEDGWTMVSWDGEPVPPASLPTALFVDVRDLITAPQYATWDISEALHTCDPTTIVNAVRDGIHQVGAATLEFPHAVIEDVVDAVCDS
jgi:broad specificity phosphatase PhoE